MRVLILNIVFYIVFYLIPNIQWWYPFPYHFFFPGEKKVLVLKDTFILNQKTGILKKEELFVNQLIINLSSESK